MPMKPALRKAADVVQHLKGGYIMEKIYRYSIKNDCSATATMRGKWVKYDDIKHLLNSAQQAIAGAGEAGPQIKACPDCGGPIHIITYRPGFQCMNTKCQRAGKL